MKKLVFEISHHFLSYSILTIILLAAMVIFVYFRSYPVLQFLVGTSAALSYALWGIIHHWTEGDLNLKIVVEYLTITAFATVVLWNILLF